MIYNGDSKEFLTLKELNDLNKEIIFNSNNTDMTLISDALQLNKHVTLEILYKVS